MGEELHTHGFDVRMQLKVLRSMLPVYRLYLKPCKIVPHLGQLLGEAARNQILQKEFTVSRAAAVDMLMEIVIAKKGDGLNLFLDAMRQFPAADFYLPPQDADRESSSENRFANEYFGFILRLLEGQIIDMLQKGDVEDIIRKLLEMNAIDEGDVEELFETLERRGRYQTAVQMFTDLSSHTDWPRKFLLALQDVKPELLQKIDPGLDQRPIVSKSDVAAASLGASAAPSTSRERSDGDEQTLCKEPYGRQRDPPRRAVAVPGCHMDTKQMPAVERPSVAGRRSAPAVAAFGSGSDDSEDGDFSDEEKYMAEESEKQQQKRQQQPVRPQQQTQPIRPPQQIQPVRPHRYDEPMVIAASDRLKPKEIKLRNYQVELAARALEGRNTIICAPTGSGKTRVALHIVQQHLQVQGAGLERKVVFLARTGPLVAQQYKTFTKFLPQYPAVLVTGESEHSQNLHGLMPTYRILVLTPKILENHLMPDKIPSLAAFSLIIFDECHHTRKGEPYNSVMKSYLKSKKKGEVLPQIVGLTASIGVEKATTVEKAKESILGVMANLDSVVISTVKENIQELMDTVPRPEELLVDLVPRDGDEVSEQINTIMMRLEEELTRGAIRCAADKEIEEIRKILGRRPSDRREQKYGQWAVALRNQVRLLKLPTTDSVDEMILIERRRQFSHEIQILADSLVAYNEALDVHDLSRPQDVLDYLQQKFLFQRTYKPPEVDTITLETKINAYFNDLEKTLQRDTTPNPNLDTLALTIIQHILEKEGEESHIIIFVRTRATCLALCNWLNSHDVDPVLQALRAQPFTGSGAHQDQGGMTQNMQQSVIEKFRTGEVKLIVSTSVGEEGIDIPECNLTIKYNHVGNEVTTVQTRGRSRKRGGVSILLAMPRIIQQERVNRQRERYMNQAIQQISTMRERDIQRHIEEVQRKTLETEEIEEVVRKVKKLPKRRGTFYLACNQCNKVRIKGSQVRKIQDAHRVILGYPLKGKVTIHSGSNPRRFDKDDMEFRGSVICRCKNRLGQLLIYKGVRFMTLGIKYWVVLDQDENPSVYRKWKDMPYPIEELNAADIKEHLRAGDFDIDDDDDGGDDFDSD